jgi:hypothetical protein
VLAIEGDAMHPFSIAEGPVLSEDLGGVCLHASMLATRQRTRE